MNPEIIVFLFLAAGTASGEDECATRPDGYHRDAACSAYRLCKAGRTVLSRTCPEGTLFNGLMCVPSALVQCLQLQVDAKQDECRGLRDGVHRDYLKSGCSYFLECRDGRVTEKGECPTAMSFNGHKCVPQKEVTCGHNSIEDIPPCTSSPGVFSTPSCRGYFYCSATNVRSQIYECPSGQVFNSTTQACVDGTSCNVAPLPGSCHNKSDGYYQDALSSGCRSYLYCFQERSITYLCPEGYAFNGTSCLVDTSFECPYWSSDCQDKADGYHADTTSGCRQYFFCLDGNRVRTLTCSHNRQFDGSKCTSRAACSPTRTVSHSGDDCESKVDGRHLVKGSKCESFITCLGGKRAATGSCTKGFLFLDGECRQAGRCPNDSQ